MAANDSIITTRRPLDPSLLNLSPEQAEFFKLLTGFKDDEELRSHIIDVQRRAYSVHEYPCIQSFAFTTLKISRLPAYKSALELSKTRPGAILLDIGCCFGNDLRKAILDGWPVENTIASDLYSEFWNYGHELFRSTSESFPAAFIPGDAFDSALLQEREPFYSPPSSPRPRDLHTLTSLNPLQGYISAIHASSFFHLFDESKQYQLAKRLATLLSPEPGSVIFGAHGGRPEKGMRTEVINARGKHMFCHSPESWKELWDGEIFRKGSVKVEAKLVERERKEEQQQRQQQPVITYWLVWSVTRL